MDKKNFIGAVVGIAIIIMGSIIVCIMRFPVGLLILLPGVIPHIINIVRWQKRKGIVMISNLPRCVQN